LDKQTSQRNTQVKEKYRIPYWFYAFVPNRLGGGLIAPLTPLFVVQVLHGNLADVGWVASLTSLASAPASIIWGNLSDRLKQRLPFMLAGLIGFAIFTILTGLAGNVPQILVYSFLGSLLGTALGPTSAALLIENIPEDQWPVSFGWFNQIGGLSYVAGMLIGTVWLQYLPGILGNDLVMRGLFLFAGGMGLVSPFLAMIWIHEVRPVQNKPRQFVSGMIGRMAIRMVERTIYHFPSPFLIFQQPFIKDLPKNLASALGKYYLYSFVLFFGINIAFMPFPLFLSQALNASNGQVFLINLAKSIVDTFFYVPMGNWMVRRRGLGLQAQAAALRAILFGLCGFLALIHAGQSGLFVIIFVQILNGISWAAISVSGPTSVADLSVRGTEARAIGTYNAVLGLAGITGNLAAGYIVQWQGYVVSFSLAAIIMLITGVLMWRLRLAATPKKSIEIS
jgi:DHA1 family multidrug resistance protein-like MFS transporter